MATGRLQHATLSYRLSEKQSIPADDMYPTICVEWARDHSRLGLTFGVN